MSAIWSARIADALRYLRSGAPSLTLNCGYGHGFSVLEVIDAVKRVSGVDFKVDIAPRRTGDPAQIVAEFRADPQRTRLAAALRRSFYHRAPCAGLGTRTDDAPDHANRPGPQSRRLSLCRGFPRADKILEFT